ncbi:hypothetical protein [Helicobacter sp. 23-1045]
MRVLAKGKGEAIQNQILRKLWDFLCEILRFAESILNFALNFAPNSQNLSAKIAKSARFCVL